MVATFVGRRTTIDEDRLVGFGAWLMPNLYRRGWTVRRLANEVGMDAGHLGKIIKSYELQNSAYARPGYENTVAIGRIFSDVHGALVAAGYAEPEDTTTLKIQNPLDEEYKVFISYYEGAPRELQELMAIAARVGFQVGISQIKEHNNAIKATVKAAPEESE